MKTNTINKASALLRQYGEGCREVSDRWAELANEAYHAGDMATVDFCMQRALDNLATANAYLGEAREGCGDE